MAEQEEFCAWSWPGPAPGPITRLVKSLLVLKTGALGDVLRTTSILPGLHAAHPELRVTWVTAPGAMDLLAGNVLVDELVSVDPNDRADVARVLQEFKGRTFDRVFSLDDEEPMCYFAKTVRSHGVSGATLSESGQRTYTPDVGE